MRFIVELGRDGRWFVTSPDDAGLLVAAKSFDAAVLAVPQALAELEKARNEMSDAFSTGT